MEIARKFEIELLKALFSDEEAFSLIDGEKLKKNSYLFMIKNRCKDNKAN